MQDIKLDIIEFVKKTTFFITALFPIWIILIIKYSITNNPNWYIVVASIIFITFIVISLRQYLQNKKNTDINVNYFKVVKKSEIMYDVLLYFIICMPVLWLNIFELPYLVPFIALLFIIYILYIKINKIYVNPIISLWYYTYEVTDDHDNTVIFFSKKPLKTGIDVKYQEIISNLNMVID